MQDNRSRLQPSAQEREKLEDRYGKIAIPALAAALDASKPPKIAEPRQMAAQPPGKWSQFDAQD